MTLMQSRVCKDQAPENRQRLIAEIERERRSKVISLFLSDRRGASAQLAEDVVRPLYDHLRAIGDADRIDLFLHSVGGQTDVPWRIVTMIRDFAKTFAVLVPYKALSAATMIALGADEIVMGRKGELGPIDPHLEMRAGDAIQRIAIEDIMSFVRFLKEKAGLSDQAALANPLAALSEKLAPWILGQCNRAHSHIRILARKLLTAHGKLQVHDEQQIQAIIDTLAEKTYQHGHAIGRKEAKDIGLNIVFPKERADQTMWDLYCAYEESCKVQEPIELHRFIPKGQDEHTDKMTMGFIESLQLSHRIDTELRVRRKRQSAPQLALNINLALPIPPGLDPQLIPASLQQDLQGLLQQLQPQIANQVQQEIQRQLPEIGLEAQTLGGQWKVSEDWPTPVHRKSARK